MRATTAARWWIFLSLSACSQEPPNFEIPPAEKWPADVRLGPPRKVTQGIDFRPPLDRLQWEERVRRVREQELVACGLWPLPERCPLEPKVTAVLDRGDYVVENLYFSSYPGFYVTGSLYRPKGKGPYPGILSPHGHFRKGRHHDGGATMRDGRANPDRYPLQARCAGFARLGTVAFLYDMVGFADSRQVKHPGDAGPLRAKEGTYEFEGLPFEQYCLSTMGLQTWNSIRALDYLLTRTEVDPERLAVTGESGGATQTLMLMMTDQRLKAAAPVCMVSPGFQGDCVCEQAALGRVGTDGVEFSAAFAPKPLIVVGATGDWTKEILERGGPEIRRTYELFGAADRVSVVRFQAPHNYNRVSREAVYTFFNRWLGLGHKEPIRERDYEPLDPKDLAVWGPGRPPPADALDAASLKAFLIRSAEERMERLRPKNIEELRTFQRIVGTALEHMVGCAGGVPCPEARLVKSGQGWELLALGRENVPALLWLPAHPNGRQTLIVQSEGIRGHCAPLTRGLVARGETVLETGMVETERGPDSSARASTAFFAAFNPTFLARRVHDILGAVAYLGRRFPQGSVSLVGIGRAGPWCLLARGLCGDSVRRTAASTERYSFRSVKDVGDEMYLPGALRYGDLGAFAALGAPAPLFVWNAEGFDSSWIRSAYASAASAEFQILPGEASTDALLENLAR